MEIDSPPYPKGSTNPEQLYEYLRELYEWVKDQEAWANMEASRLKAPQDPFVPPLGPPPSSNASRYMTLSVPDMFMSWQSLRNIRERYDSVVRNYEEQDAWSSDACVYHRINLVKAAAMLLSIAFLDREKREAKEMEMARQSRKEFMRFLKKSIGSLSQMFEEDEDEDDEIDFDSLFNPPEDDDDE